MKFLFDLFPVITFFIAFKLAEAHEAVAQTLVQNYLGQWMGEGPVSAHLAPALLATVVAMITTVLQIVYLRVRRQKIDAALWMAFVTIVVFGSATIYFHDVRFIKLKPTILYVCFALAMLVPQLLFKKNMMRSAMEENLTLPEQVWDRLSYAYIGFFLLQAAANLFVGFVLYPNEADFSSYATFKAFGLPGMFVVFFVLQTIYLSRYMDEGQT
jgi:intracellular septation protein